MHQHLKDIARKALSLHEAEMTAGNGYTPARYMYDPVRDTWKEIHYQPSSVPDVQHSVSDVLPAVPDVSPTVPEVPVVTEIPEGKVKCPECDGEFTKKHGLVRHIAKAHRDPHTEGVDLVEKNGKSTKMWTCHLCNKKLKEKNCRSHLKNYHSSVRDPSLPTVDMVQKLTTLAAATPTVDATAQSECPFCHISILPYNLRKHVRNNHDSVWASSLSVDHMFRNADPQAPTTGTPRQVTCPGCSASIPWYKLRRHIKKEHSDVWTPRVSVKKLFKQKKDLDDDGQATTQN